MSDSIEQVPHRTSHALRILANQIEANEAPDFGLVLYNTPESAWMNTYKNTEDTVGLLGAIELLKMNIMLEGDEE